MSGPRSNQNRVIHVLDIERPEIMFPMGSSPTVKQLKFATFAQMRIWVSGSRAAMPLVQTDMAGNRTGAEGRDVRIRLETVVQFRDLSCFLFTGFTP